MAHEPVHDATAPGSAPAGPGASPERICPDCNTYMCGSATRDEDRCEASIIAALRSALASERAARESWEREFNVANAERIRLHNEAENFSERLGQFEAAGFPNVATVLDRVEADRAAREAAGARVAELEQHRTKLDCRFVGNLAEMDGSHCPTGEPCQRCELEQAREKAEARLRETELWHRAAVRERDLMREQMDEILRYEDIETPGPDENVASVVLAALEHLREARAAAERELASLTTDRDSWVEQADQRATEAVEYLRRATAAESSLSRAVEALREIEQKTGHFGEAPPPPEWMPMLSLIAWVGKTARAALAGQEVGR